MSGEIKYSFVGDGKYVVFEDGRIFKQYDAPSIPSGYKYLILGNKTRLLHRIIASTFIPNPENKPEVNHIDGNKTNNAASNLEWVTRSENVRHAIEHGLFSKTKKHSPSREENKIYKIRKAVGLSQKQLADAVGVDQSSISLWESGKVAPTVAKIRQIADVLGISPGDLF